VRLTSQCLTDALAEIMTLNAHRPYCSRPILGAALNLALGLVVIAVARLLESPNSIYWLAASFAAWSILFLILAVTAHGFP